VFRPRLLPDRLTTPLVARARHEDFRVVERPALEPTDEGEHTMVEIAKRGISTHEAIQRLARAAGVRPSAIGHAGLKDARAVAVQRLTVAGVEPRRLEGLEQPGLVVSWARRTRAKLQPGQTRGNRFELVVRGLDEGDAEGDGLARLEAGLAELARRGVPGWFGAQRFGHRGDSGRIGAALFTERYDDAVDMICGRPGPHDHGRVLEAREAFAAGDLKGAERAWPRSYRDARAVCRALLRGERDLGRVLLGLDRKTLRLFASAAQSELFNAVLARRMPDVDRLIDGDVVRFATSNSGFVVERAADEQHRADAFELSPSGPMFGAKEQRPVGAALELEEAVLDASGLEREDFARRGPLYCAGTRRPLRFMVEDAQVEAGADDLGRFARLTFALGPGVYATSVLDELSGGDLVEVERDDQGREILGRTSDRSMDGHDRDASEAGTAR